MTGGEGLFGYNPAHPLGPWYPVDTTYAPYFDWARDSDGHAIDGYNIDGAIISAGRITVIASLAGVYSVFASKSTLYVGYARWVIYNVHPTHGWG